MIIAFFSLGMIDEDVCARINYQSTDCQEYLKVVEEVKEESKEQDEVVVKIIIEEKQMEDVRITTSIEEE